MVDNASLVHHILKNNFSRNDYGGVYTLITLKFFFEAFLVVSHITFIENNSDLQETNFTGNKKKLMGSQTSSALVNTISLLRHDAKQSTGSNSFT